MAAAVQPFLQIVLQLWLVNRIMWFLRFGELPVRKRMCLIVLMLLLTGGCGWFAQDSGSEPEPAPVLLSADIALPQPAGGFVMVVCGEVVTADDIITAPIIERFRPFAGSTDPETFSRQARASVEQLVTSRLTNVLLCNQARRELGDKLDEGLGKAAEQEVRKFVASFGGDYARAEQALAQMDMDWAEFKDYQKKMILSQYYVSSKLPEASPVTYTMLVNEYNKVKGELYTEPAIITFRLIDVEVAKVRTSDAYESRLEAARRLARELMERIGAGEDFGELAQEYSHGHRRALGGLWNPVQPTSLARPYDILAAYCRDMEPGELAGPIEAGGHIFIMTLEDKRAEKVEPLEKVQKQLEAKIQLERRKRALDEFGKAIVEQAAVSRKAAFVEFCTKELYRRSLVSAK